MSMPHQFAPPPQKPGSGNKTLLIVLLALGLVSMIACCGICGGLTFLVRSKATFAGVKQSIEERINPPLVGQRWEQDWMVMEHLSRAYTTALDAVVADKRVVERLGQPVEPLLESDKLFRRDRTGKMNSTDETIEFDVQGPKGKAVVRVETAPATGLPGSFPWTRASQITVKLSDGTEIDVPPPVEKMESAN
jgi:hypothetical protein